jgi:DNA-directed RNA polymerase subunit beta
MPSIFDAPNQGPFVPKEPDVLQALSPRTPLRTPPVMREFGDTTAVRKNIYNNVRTAAQALEPVTNQTHTLQLVDVDYDDEDKDISLADQKKALLEKRNLRRSLRGTWQLLDNATGTVLDTKRSTIAQVPYFSNRGTFIRNGNEYTLSNQMRLRPGIYHRKKDNGELEADIRVKQGTGLQHRIYLEPSTGIFKAKVANANIPLVSILRAMGATDKEIRTAWGDLSAANMQKASPADLAKIYSKFVRGGVETDARSRQEAIANAFAKMELDTETTARTLGRPTKRVTVESLLASTRKLLAIQNKADPKALAKLGLGPSDVDDRDSLAFMRFLGPEDLFAERIGKNKALLNRALWKATAKKDVQGISAGLLNKSLDSVLFGSLAQPLEAINPAQIFEQQSRVSKMGAGGIPDPRAVPIEARNVQASHFGFIDPIITPESERAGVDLRMARSSRKGEDGKIYSHMRDVRTGEMVWRDPEVITSSVVAFPGELRSGKSRVAAMSGGTVKYVTPREVDYEVPHMENAFSFLANMIPMKSATKAQRSVMAARMLTQALPLDNAEAPLVQAGIPGEDGSFEQRYGSKLGAVRAKQGGVVTKVTGDEFTVKYVNGDTETVELYNNYPYNRKTFIHQDLLVQKGQRFSKGELLAKSNFVDSKGTAALGLNARVAYIPFRGLNFEDAVVVSESFAKRLSSQHMYKTAVDFSEEKVRTSRAGFTAMFPGKFNRSVLENMDNDGVVKPGTTVNNGDPLVLVIRKREQTANQVSRGRASKYADKTQVWSHHAPGIVADVAKTKNGTLVTVKSTVVAKVGDKLSGRYGDKGVISEIIPDDEMPVAADGRSTELLLNPLGIISRTNPAQMVEAALGKIAERTGKAYTVHDFEDIQDLTEFAMRELEANGMQDLETIVDPTNGRQIKDVFTGNRFFMKLHHVAEAKGSGRSFGGYTSEGRPSKGGEDGAKTIGMLELNALLSHGATEVIRDAKLIRGQMNPDYWSAYQSGFKPAAPKVPMVYEKFVNQLKAAGINPVRRGTRTHLLAMTESDITKLAGEREITASKTVDWKTGLKPLKGGLFDPELTGGHGGDKWSFIRLAEPMPNPAMQEPIMRVLGLTQSQFRDVVAGKQELSGHTGSRAIAYALDKINLKQAVAQAREDVKSAKGARRNAAVKRLRYFKGAEKQQVHPREWMLSRVPVLPPAFRPISVMQGTGNQLISDTNYLYRDLFESNKFLKENSQRSDDIGDERLAVYDSFKAITGLGDPVSADAQEKEVRGVLREIFGKNPKYSVVQRKLLSSTTDLVGRAAITPNPDLDMDQVGIPEDKAWEVYQPLIVRELGRRGVPRLDAARAVKDRTDIARKEMLKIMSKRPVVVNRAPVLHRYGVMAFWPQLVKNDTMQVSPLIVGGFGADFDGDAMQYHIPVSSSAVDEAINKLLPSRNLFSAASFNVHYKPSQEYTGGLHAASTNKSRKGPRTFSTKAEAIRAYRRGEIDAGQQVTILND